MIERNMQNNVEMLKRDLNAITNTVRNMMQHCDKQLDQVIDYIDEKSK